MDDPDPSTGDRPAQRRSADRLRQGEEPSERRADRADGAGASTSGITTLQPAEPDRPGAEPDAPELFPKPTGPRQLHPLPPGLVELYGLLAVLVVLVPEWMASGALFGFREGRQGTELPLASGAWRRLPELRLATMNLRELRDLARQQRLWGYGRDSRATLTTRLLRRLRAGP